MHPRKAADYLGVAKSTLDKKRMRGTGPKFIRVGRAVYYARSDLDAYVAALPRFATTSEADGAKQ